MIDFIPYFAGIITLIFGFAFALAIREGGNVKNK